MRIARSFATPAPLELSTEEPAFLDERLREPLATRLPGFLLVSFELPISIPPVNHAEVHPCFIERFLLF